MKVIEKYNSKQIYLNIQIIQILFYLNYIISFKIEKINQRIKDKKISKDIKKLIYLKLFDNNEIHS